MKSEKEIEREYERIRKLAIHEQKKLSLKSDYRTIAKVGEIIAKAESLQWVLE